MLAATRYADAGGAGKSKDWSLSEWIANFLEDDNLYYEDDMYGGGGEGDDDDVFEGTIGAGEGDVDDGGVLESIVIIGVTMALVFLVWWRQRMQQAHAEAEEERRRNQGQAAAGAHQPAANRGGDGADAFGAWAAGGVGL